MKRLVVCCDGTWQRANQDYPTNVAKMSQAIKQENTDPVQLLHYEPGLGSGGRFLDRVFGGAFGWGIDDHIQRAYRFLCANYADGDEIYLFGFSRGAYIVRSLAGLMRVAHGLLPSNEVLKVPAVYEVYRSQGRYSGLDSTEINRREVARKEAAIQAISADIRPAMVTVLGCWDTVGSLGIPNTVPLLSQQINKKYEFHDFQLSNIIERALHGVAIDEPRQAFDVTPMMQSRNNLREGQVLQEVWFPGNHGAVGGGSPRSQPLADGALLWMIDTIRNTFNLGLEFDLSHVEYDPTAVNPAQHYGLRPDPTAKIPEEPIPFLFQITGLKPRTIADDAELHQSVFDRWRALETYRPENMPKPLVAQLNQGISATA
jgi:uncharacterized protein (DUF2235 family)